MQKSLHKLSLTHLSPKPNQNQLFVNSVMVSKKRKMNYRHHLWNNKFWNIGTGPKLANNPMTLVLKRLHMTKFDEIFFFSVLWQLHPNFEFDKI